MQTTESIRLFLSIPCPSALRQKLLDVQGHLPAATWTLNLTDAEDFHLTLLFLGQTPARAVDDLRREFGAAAHARHPFDVQVRGLGVFRDWSNPKVVWAGIDDRAGKLEDLHGAAKRVAARFQTHRVTEPFAPHITLARVDWLSASWNPQLLQSLIDSQKSFGSYPVEEFSLLQSRQRPACDEILGTFRLLA